MLLEAAAGGTAVDAVSFLREFGFPVFMCLWFMWRIEKKLDNFTASIDKLLQIVIVMAKTMDSESSKGEKGK